MPLLELRNLKKYYATQKAVDDISFTVEKGNIFGLLGPNGAGKTTLLRMITGIFFPDEGEIIFDGQKFNVLSDAVKIGYMPEERGLYKKMKIGEQVLYLAQLKGLRRADAMEKIKYWFEKLEMQSWWNKKVEDLSKGMGQKLQFVTTVLHDPKLIILDEPFSGFDPVNAEIIKDEILELNRKGATILFSTHRMESVEELCDAIALLDRSKKILDGKIRDIKNTYRNNIYLVEYEGKKIDYNGAAPFELIDEIAGLDNNFTIRIKLNAGTNSNDVLQYLIPKARVNMLREVIPSMNEIFIEKVNQIA